VADTPEHPFGRRSNERSNGKSLEGMGTRPVPIDDVPSERLDFVAVQADDELINALAGGLRVSPPGLGGYDADDQVAAMLAAWKADVDADPVPVIDLDKAVGAVLAGRRPSGRLRHLVPVAAAAALIVVAITGVSIAAHDTRPGDALFSVSKVLYSEEAASYEALATVQQSRERAEQALAVGDKKAAETALAEGQAAAGNVLAEHGRGEVEQRLHKLEVVVEDAEPGVPTVVDDDEDEPSSGGASGKGNEPAATDPSTTSSQTSSGGGPADPRASDNKPGTQDPGSSDDHRSDQRSADAPGKGTDGPGTSDPGTKDPGTKDPGTKDPGTKDPGTKDPGTKDPGTKDPGTSQPGTSDPGTSDPRTSDPRTSDPRTSDPDTSAPGTSESEPDTHRSNPRNDRLSKPAPQPNFEDDPQSRSLQSQSQSPSPSSAEDPTQERTSAPATTKPPASREGSAGTTGISGASMSATGTATPSGEPTT
jgi:hypothetical protein